jgi:hypothetical protein
MVFFVGFRCFSIAPVFQPFPHRRALMSFLFAILSYPIGVFVDILGIHEPFFHSHRHSYSSLHRFFPPFLPSSFLPSLFFPSFPLLSFLPSSFLPSDLTYPFF